MKTSVKEKIKEAIENYCEGIEWLEFSKNDLDSMVDDIEKIVEAEKRSNDSWEAEFRII
jgi:predicted DNA-binding protein